VTGDSERDFLEFGRGRDAPMYIVTTSNGRTRAGCLIGFATQVSISPGRFLACLSVKNHTHRVAVDAQRLAVHAVPRDRKDLAELFGGETGDEVDKFTRCAWTPADDGTPLLDDCPGRFLGDVLERLDLGDHTGYLLRPVAAWPHDGPQLTMRHAMEIEPGHEP
jgi:flavin reductase (DIM6/NTAB) family NADH-FMN oxidoreductase RutF